MKILVTGSSGYYGNILCNALVDAGHNVTGVDINSPSEVVGINFILCDLCDYESLYSRLKSCKFDAIIHLASQIDFAVRSQRSLYETNTVATKNTAQIARLLGVKKLIFTSSNSVFLGSQKNLILSDDEPAPIDMYGKSKVDSEKILYEYQKFFDVIIIRCPNIIDVGRVGMLSILFVLLREGANLWVLGEGSVRHQCLYAGDLSQLIMKLLKLKKSETYNIGSENVPTFKEMFEYLIKVTGSKSKIRSVPKFIVVPILKLAYKFNLSPLGPYQFRMLTRDFKFDLSKVVNELDWRPTKNNSEIIELAYQKYCQNLDTYSFSASANSSPVRMGLLNILKYIKW